MEYSINNISIVSPVFNEEKYLPGFIDQLLRETNKLKAIKKIIFVDDGSRDTTSKILEKYRKENPIITVITHKKIKVKEQLFDQVLI